MKRLETITCMITILAAVLILSVSCGVKYADLEVDLFKNTRLDTTAQTLPGPTVVTNYVEKTEIRSESIDRQEKSEVKDTTGNGDR